MNLEQLTAAGGVRPAELVKREITWTRLHPESGDELTDVFDVHVRRLAYIDQEQMLALAYRQATLDDDEEDEKRQSLKPSTTAALISVAVRFGPDADEQLTYEQARQLETNLARALLDAINAVNPVPVKKKARTRGNSLARAGAKRGGRPNDRAGKAQPDAS